VYNSASISLFILLSDQLPRTIKLILENNLVSFEYFSFWQWTELKVCKFEIDCWFLLLFLGELYFILCMFCIFVCFIFVYFWCQELWLFYVHFFSHSFFLVKYLILLMFCFIMYWPTDNSDILRLYSTHSCNKNKNAWILNFIQNWSRLCDWEVITCMILLFVQTFAACFVYTKYTEISLQVRTYCWYWIITYTEV
jgi:hypothetical protein